MQAEGHIMANFNICLIVFAFAPAIQYLLISHLGYGLMGAGDSDRETEKQRDRETGEGGGDRMGERASVCLFVCLFVCLSVFLSQTHTYAQTLSFPLSAHT